MLTKKDFPLPNSSNTSLNSAIKAHQRYLLKSENEDLNEAINSYVEAIKKDPSLASPYYHLAALLYNQGQISLEGAIEQCKKAVWLDDKDPNAHTYLGYFLSLKEEFDAAKEEFLKALKLNPAHARTRLVLAITMLENIKKGKKTPSNFLKALWWGATGSVLSVFDKASLKMFLKNVINDINFIKLKAMGEIYEKIDEKKAYNIYLSAVDSTTKSISMYEKMASIALSNKRYDVAFDCLNNAVILSDNDPDKIVSAIEFVERYQIEKTDTLIDYYTLLINRYPDFAKCYYELGHLYLKKDEKLSALSAFQMALKYDKDNPYYENSLAFAYIQLEQYDSAITYYQRALEKNPDPEWTAIVAQALAAIYYQVKQNPEAALSTLEGGLALAKNKTALYEAMADIYFDIEESQTAIEYYELALKENSENPKLYSRLALACWEEDLVEKAIIYYTKALELDSKYDIASNNLGVVFLDGLGDIERAQLYFNNALEINCDYALAHFNLARSYEAQNKKIEAAKEYQKALDLNNVKKELDSEIIEEKLHKLFEA